jgi:Transposase
MKLKRIGVDLAKNVFQIHGVDSHERPVWRQRLPRERCLQTVLEKIEPRCEIGMESCGGAHHWARQLQSQGYRVKLIAPQFVKPYVKSNKNDANDAEAICEAMSRPSMRFVAMKTVEQQDIQATHRIRSGLIEQRNAKANQIRGLVSEYGLVAAKELRSVCNSCGAWGPLRPPRCSRDWRCAIVCQRSSACCLARINTAPAQFGRERAPVGHQQAGRCVRAIALGAWCTSDDPHRQDQGGSTEPMGHQSGRTIASECRLRGIS